jgi:6-phosphofructokinase 1
MATSRPISRIGILTGGGDAPGLNAVIRAVVKAAANVHGWETVGIEDGFEGLVTDAPHRILRPDDVRGLLPRGGTILGSSNKGRFTGGRHRAGIPPGVLDEAVTKLGELGLDALVTIGGDGTQTIASAFAARGVRIMGVPKTIDNDIEGTELTFGFNSALELATDAIDRLHTTAESHDRCMLLEVMGRRTGWIALHAALAGGADAVLIPEIPYDLERVAEAIRRRDAAGHKFSIVVVAEGAAPQGGDVTLVAEASADESRRLGGVAHRVGDELKARTGKETRSVVLGHLQRGGPPTAFDRLLATSFGTAAVRALARGEHARIVAIQGGSIVTIPLETVAGRTRRVPLSSPLLRTATELGVEFGADPAVTLPDDDSQG